MRSRALSSLSIDAAPRPPWPSAPWLSSLQCPLVVLSLSLTPQPRKRVVLSPGGTRLSLSWREVVLWLPLVVLLVLSPVPRVVLSPGCPLSRLSSGCPWLSRLSSLQCPLVVLSPGGTRLSQSDAVSAPLPPRAQPYGGKLRAGHVGDAGRCCCRRRCARDTR